VRNDQGTVRSTTIYPEPDIVAIVGADLEGVRAPSEVRVVQGDAPIVPPFDCPPELAGEQQPMSAHDPVNALVVRARLAELRTCGRKIAWTHR
jgi:hypothetical protein